MKIAVIFVLCGGFQPIEQFDLLCPRRRHSLGSICVKAVAYSLNTNPTFPSRSKANNMFSNILIKITQPSSPVVMWLTRARMSRRNSRSRAQAVFPGWLTPPRIMPRLNRCGRSIVHIELDCEASSGALTLFLGVNANFFGGEISDGAHAHPPHFVEDSR